MKKRIAEEVRIKTNDPDQPVLVATVKGFVEKFAEITPERVRLMGLAGKPLFARIEIIPRMLVASTFDSLKKKGIRSTPTYIFSDGHIHSGLLRSPIWSGG